MNTLKPWLEIYIASNSSKLYCKVEDDLKRINLKGISFTQFKCYSRSFSFRSIEVKKSFYNFYCLFYKYFNDNPSFIFIQIQILQSQTKLLLTWVNSQNNLSEILIQEIILKVLPILEKEFEDQFNSDSKSLTKQLSNLDTNEKLTAKKKQQKKSGLEGRISEEVLRLAQGKNGKI